MPNIKELRERIQSVNATQKMTKTMQLVSSSKLIKAQHQLTQTRKYTECVTQVFNNIIDQNNSKVLKHYMHPNNVNRRLIIIVSTDKGLCGSFNTNIIKQTEAYLAANKLSNKEVDILTIGKKVTNHFKRQNYNLITTYQAIGNKLQWMDVKEATHWVINAFLKSQYSSVELMYNSLKSAAMQVVQVEKLLPLNHSLLSTYQKNNVHGVCIFELSQKELIEEMIPLRLTSQWYNALVTSNAAEHSARMTAMSKASENANTILKSLRVTYNTRRQESITNEILEIAAGAEAWRKA